MDYVDVLREKEKGKKYVKERRSERVFERLGLMILLLYIICNAFI